MSVQVICQSHLLRINAVKNAQEFSEMLLSNDDSVDSIDLVL